MNGKQFSNVFDRTCDNVNTVIHGKEDVVRLAMIAICANGHVLFEDVPGVGKSMLARALAQSMQAETARVQCTPDMLPGDITGSSIIETKTMQFTFRRGPVFTNILLVDEINRATPKTQSALLESMAERNVTVEGTTHPLPNPFLVLATQNPVELAGTFPLPEAQLDRFLLKLQMGYPSIEAERLVVTGNASSLEVEGLGAVTSTSEILEMQQYSASVELPAPVLTYILEVVAATRDEAALLLGASPRASISLARAAKVVAAADGRETVYPDDVQALLRPILGHRMLLTPDAVLRGVTIDDVLERVAARVKPPLGISTGGGISPSAEANGETDSTTARSRRQRRPVGARRN